MKKLLALSVLLALTLSINSQNTFKLGFTGAYPTSYQAGSQNFNYSYYDELKVNTIQGWWT